MKKLILLALTAVIMAGCETNPVVTQELFEIDSCEYFMVLVKDPYKSQLLMSHKGNCRFCAERRKQELQSVVEQLKDK